MAGVPMPKEPRPAEALASGGGPGGRPPLERIRIGRWVHENLFPNWWNGLLTIVFGFLLGVVAFRAIKYVFFTGRWEIVRRNLANLMVGGFPRDQLWRPWAAFLILAVVFGIRAGAVVARRRRVAEEAGLPAPPSQAMTDVARRSWPLIVFFVIVVLLARTWLPILLLAGVAAVAFAAREAGRRLPPGLERWTTVLAIVGLFAAVQVIVALGGVGWDKWGGVLLLVFLAAGGIVLSFPIGVLLALGRRSTLPVVRTVSVVYIELIRGVPLITLLLIGAFALGFFLPRGFSTPSLVTRALVAFVMFTAAYMAEIIRGGLQAVPRGQIEAAQALGLAPPKVMRLIVLPQALRAVIPAIVGQFISLFKDVSLAAIIGLTEVLGWAQRANAQPDFLGKGLHAETTTFAAFVFWVGAYWMSRTSQRLEKRLGVGER